MVETHLHMCMAPAPTEATFACQGKTARGVKARAFCVVLVHIIYFFTRPILVFPLHRVPTGTESASAGNCTPAATNTCQKSHAKDASESFVTV
jgi:hypothetical protein